MHTLFGPAIDAWLAYDEKGFEDYVDSLPDDHPIVEYLYYINNGNSGSEGVEGVDNTPVAGKTKADLPPAKKGNTNTEGEDTSILPNLLVAGGGLAAAGAIGGLGGTLFNSMGKDKYDPFDIVY
jgi:hypothetical protein